MRVIIDKGNARNNFLPFNFILHIESFDELVELYARFNIPLAVLKKEHYRAFPVCENSIDDTGMITKVIGKLDAEIKPYLNNV